MKQKTINIYKFEELSEESQAKAIEKLCDLNVDYEWWEYIYEEAESIGFRLTGFDIGRANSIDYECLWNVDDIAESILENHGETCETYQLAKGFLKSYDELTDEEEDEFHNDKREELENEFLRTLGEEYLHTLRKGYEYLTSEEAIKESILANEYEFLENGDLI